MSDALSPSPAPKTLPKPKLRGIFHLLAALAVLPFGIGFIRGVAPALTTAASLYCLSLLLLFSVSALYHVPMWAPATRARLRRLDHAMIYVLIGGSYLPYLAALEENAPGWLAPAVILTTFVGVLKSLLWTGSSRLLRSLPFLVFGLAAFIIVPALSQHFGGAPVALLIGGGALYGFGIVFYVRKRPNPWPSYFGYHEIFHLFVNGAAACHFWSIWQVTESYQRLSGS